ncbi:hypothetical protein EJB05_45978, partial [Eragrostis curvula]
MESEEWRRREWEAAEAERHQDGAGGRRQMGGGIREGRRRSGGGAGGRSLGETRYKWRRRAMRSIGRGGGTGTRGIRSRRGTAGLEGEGWERRQRMKEEGFSSVALVFIALHLYVLDTAKLSYLIYVCCLSITEHHISDISNKPGVYGGAIIICNRLTKRDFFQHKLFALPGYAATFIKKIRAGMLLFLFEFEERKLYGVFEAASDGALDILPDAFASLWRFRPAQVLFRRVWFCKPLTVAEFSGAIEGDFLRPHMSFFGISYQQVLNLLDLFSLKMIQLQTYQKPKSRVISDYKVSLARTGQDFSLKLHSNACPSRYPSMFHNNRTSLPHSPFVYAKHHGKRATRENESSLHYRPKPVVLKTPDIKEKCLERDADIKEKHLVPDADYIPLELDDLDDYKSESDADQSTLLGTVRLHSTLKSDNKYEDPVTKQLNGKHSEYDSYHSHQLNRRVVSECETDQKNAIAHNVKESKSSLQNKGCKRKAVVRLGKGSDVLSPRRVCSAAKKVSFSIGGNEVSVTHDRKKSSDKSLCKPAFAENRDRVVGKGKEEVCFSPQDIQSKENHVSAKRTAKEASAAFSPCFEFMKFNIDSLTHFHCQSCMLSRNLVSFGMVKAQRKECLAFGGAIFLCSHLTRKECFEKKIFGLSPNYAGFVEKVKAGTTLFLFDVDQHKLHGIRFKRIWFCKPLMEGEFQDAVQNSFVIKNKSTFRLSHQQVAKLLHLFSSRKRLQPPQNPRSQDDPSMDFEISSHVKETDMQSSSNNSSCGSFRSPCQTCSSTTLGDDAASLGHRLVDPISLVRKVLQSDGSDMAKSNSSISSLHTGADMSIVTIPSNQEAMCDQSTDDFIPLPQEEDVLDGVDDLFGLLDDENHSGSSDSEDNSFRQACVRKEDGCHPLMVNSKLRSDIERRKSVFSRIVRANEVFNQRKRSKTKAFPQKGAEYFNPLYQTKKQRRAQKKTFSCRNDGMLDKPSTDRMNGVQPLDNSFFWSDNRRSTKFFVREEDRNKWDVSSKEPVRADNCRKLFVPKGGAKWDKSCDKEVNTPPFIAGVQESGDVSVKIERTPSLNFKRRAKVLNVGGDQEFDIEDAVEAGQRKIPPTAPFHQEYPSDTALVPKGAKTMDMLAISDENYKEKSISLPSKGTHTQARPYLETKMLLEQQKSIEMCSEYGEDVTRDTPLIIESSRTMDSLTKQSFGDRKTFSNDETGSHVVADHLVTETYIQEKQNPNVSSCNRVVNGDKILSLGNFGSMDFLPNHDEGCGNKRSFQSDGSNRPVTCLLETEMALQQKQTPYIQSCSEVERDDKVLVPEISEVVFPKVDADCVYKGTSLASDHREEVCHIVSCCHDVVPSDAAPVLESCGPLSNLTTLHGDSAKNNSSLDETSGHVSTGYEDNVMLPQDEHYHSCCGDTSSVLEYTTVDTCTVDGGSGNKNSDQKDDEVLYSVTDSKDHVSNTNTSSSDGSRSFGRADDQECSKVVLLNEEQCQNFRSRPELAYENSNSVDSFAVSAEGCGSKSETSADRAYVQRVTDLLGTNSESRTSFTNDSSRGSVETPSTPALGSENAEAYAEQPILQHDPGETKTPL